MTPASTIEIHMTAGRLSGLFLGRDLLSTSRDHLDCAGLARALRIARNNEIPGFRTALLVETRITEHFPAWTAANDPEGCRQETNVAFLAFNAIETEARSLRTVIGERLLDAEDLRASWSGNAFVLAGYDRSMQALLKDLYSCALANDIEISLTVLAPGARSGLLVSIPSRRETHQAA